MHSWSKKIDTQTQNKSLTLKNTFDMATNNKTVTVTISNTRFSYLHVLEPAPGMDGQEGKYSGSFIIRKDDTVNVPRVKAALNEMIADAKQRYQGRLPNGFRIPLRDGDEDRPNDAAYAGAYFINANSMRKPSVCKYIGNKKTAPLASTDELYSGCYGAVNITFFAYDRNGNRGIGASLNGLAKVRDGEPLGGSSAANIETSVVSVADELDAQLEAHAMDVTGDLPGFAGAAPDPLDLL